MMSNQNNILNERVSSIVYHYCGYVACYGICENNQFVLSHIMRGTADGNINKTYHYLSLTRQKTRKIGYSQYKDVRITLDGDKLNSRYKGGPVDYWGTSMGKQYYMQDGNKRGRYDPKQSRTENEDRVFSNDPVIPNASDYILRIDILLLPERNGEYHPYYVKLIQEILKTGFHNLVFVYGDENSFDAQNDNTINEQVLSMQSDADIKDKPYEGSLRYALLDLLNTMFSYEYRRDEIWPQAYKKLRQYGISRYIIQEYGQNFLNSIREELPRKSWFMNDLLANAQNMIDGLRSNDKTLYVRAMRMFNDYLREHSLFGLNDLYAYKKRLANSVNSSGLDWNKQVEVLALVDLNYERGSEYVSGAIAIPNPDMTSIWKVIPQERRYFVEDVTKYYPEHNSRDDEYFKKYLQHLVRQETSVNAFIDFLNKVKLPDEAKQEITMYKKFDIVTLRAYNYDNARYLSPEDKKQVEQSLSFDETEQPGV